MSMTQTIMSEPDPVPVKTVDAKAPPKVIVWRNVYLMSILHLAAIWGLVLILKGDVMWKTTVFSLLLYIVSGLGITAGAHRLWAHKTYKAKLPLRILLSFFNAIAFQNSIYEWSRDHRVHHKYSETDGDPHNATRGFFFAHIGWLLVRKHPDVITKGRTIDMNDLLKDPVVAFQKKYYIPYMILSCFVFPTVFPWYFWGESWYSSFYVAVTLRYCWVLHMTWLVNSAAHMWGNRPYDKTINPRENILVSLGAVGEGFHNYHHTFPWDYSTSELGMKLNLTTFFIHFMARIGLAYDLRKVSSKVIRQRMLRTGDGSGHHHQEVSEEDVQQWLEQETSVDELREHRY